MSTDEEERLRVRRQVSLRGEESLNRLDRWRWREMQRADERQECRSYSAEVERAQQGYAAVVDAMEGWTTWLQGQVETLRANQEQIVAEVNEAFEAIGRIHEGQGRDDAQRDDAIRELKAQISDLRTKAAEARVAELNTLHASLVRSAELSMKSFEQAAQRAELSTTEWDQVVAVGAKANELTAQLQQLREAQRNFKFSRELANQDREDIVDLPADYFSSRRH